MVSIPLFYLSHLHGHLPMKRCQIAFSSIAGLPAALTGLNAPFWGVVLLI